MNYWLIKSDPDAYSFVDMVRDKTTDWDGVRNYQARNNLKAMKHGDLILFYHSVKFKEVVGIVEVSKEYYQDPTTDDDRWVAVEVTLKDKFSRPVTLSEIKAAPPLADIALIKQSRLSVMPLTKDEFEFICKMGAE